jgi:hypothetical protein
MVNGSYTRIPPEIELALKQINGIIPDVVTENVLLVLTNCSKATKNFDKKVLGAEIPDGRTFYVDNSIFSNDPKTYKPEDINTHNKNIVEV